MGEPVGIVVVVNPVSSGMYVARAFQDSGVATVHVYQQSLLAAARRDTTAVRIVEHHDTEATLRVLADIRPLAVVPGSESAVALANDLALGLGLPHNVPELTAARRDKDLMLAAVLRAGVPVGRSFAVHDEEELGKRLAELGEYPVVVKPKNSAGSDGMRICDTAAEALAAFRDSHEKINIVGELNDGMLVQEYLDGVQFMVNTVSTGGRHLLTDFYEQRIDRLPGRSVSRHLKSRTSLNSEDEDVVEYALACLDALGVREGAGHTEVRMTSRGPRLVEVNARLMGPVMEPDPYYVAFGYSPQHLLAERYLDERRFLARFGRPHAAKWVLARSYLRTGGAGTVGRVHDLDRLRTLPAFHSVHGIPPVGSRVEDPFLTTASSGTVYFVGPEAVVDASLAELHDLEDRGTFFDIVPDH